MDKPMGPSKPMATTGEAGESAATEAKEHKAIAAKHHARKHHRHHHHAVAVKATPEPAKTM